VFSPSVHCIDVSRNSFKFVIIQISLFFVRYCTAFESLVDTIRGYKHKIITDHGLILCKEEVIVSYYDFTTVYPNNIIRLSSNKRI
jgi:hypothetical protein